MREGNAIRVASAMRRVGLSSLTHSRAQQRQKTRSKSTRAPFFEDRKPKPIIYAFHTILRNYYKCTTLKITYVWRRLSKWLTEIHLNKTRWKSIFLPPPHITCSIKLLLSPVRIGDVCHITECFPFPIRK